MTSWFKSFRPSALHKTQDSRLMTQDSHVSCLASCVLRLASKHILVIVLLVVHLSPIWAFKYFPSQDGPSHIYNAYVLKEYHKHENYKIREVFRLNITLFPNWFSHAFMALLMYVFPPIICEKILVSLCIALLPLSLFYFLNAVDRGKTLFGLLGFIYAYNYLLHMGFYNFALSMSMFFFTLGYWWRHKDKMGPANIAILYVLLLATYLCHYQSYFQLLLSLSFFAFFSYLYSAFVETWGTRKESQNGEEARSDSLKAFIRKLKPFLIFLGSMIPAYFIMFSYYLSSTSGYFRYYWDSRALKEYFFDCKSLVYFQDKHIFIMHVMMVFLAVVFLLTLWDRIIIAYKSRRAATSSHSNAGAAEERLWTKIINGQEQFLLMAGILTLIFFKSPWNLASGGGWINDRVQIYIFLVLLPFFNVNFHKYIRYAMAGIMIGLSLWHLGYSVRDYHYLNKEIADLTSGVGMLEENTAFTVRSSDWYASDYLGGVYYVSPFLHAPNYYCLKNRVAYTQDFEANVNYFPINFKGGYSGPMDYVLAWWVTDPDELKDLENDYELIHSGKHSKLYRLKKAKPDETLWSGKNVVKFDMQPHDSQAAPEHIAVFADTIYTDGKYGWATKSIRNEYLSEADIPEPYRDAVWGEDDGVFRVALPNGTYKVTCYFCSGGSASYEINIIANGKKVINNLKIPAGNETFMKSYNITVTDERLTQVIYTRWEGLYKTWIWNGCTIERGERAIISFVSE